MKKRGPRQGPRGRGPVGAEAPKKTVLALFVQQNWDFESSNPQTLAFVLKGFVGVTIKGRFVFSHIYAATENQFVFVRTSQ